MKNILFYMKKFGNKSFDEFPFNDVDALVLAELTYLNYENLVPGLEDMSEDVLFEDLIHEDMMIIKMCQGTIDVFYNRRLLKLIRKTSRFKNMKVNFFHKKFNPKVSKQFCALTFIFDDFAFVAYQGTDPTIIGWKEDFESSFIHTIPAQQEAVDYLNNIGKVYKGNFYVGGHSKGGNLTFYAVLKCEAEIRHRIIKIYNFDGPGFKKEDIFLTEAYQELKDKMIKYVPQDTIIGLLMHHTDYDYVVKCYSISFLQHDPFNWKVTKEGRFDCPPNKSIRYKVFAKASLMWMEKINDEQRKRFIDITFNIIGAYGTIGVIDVIRHPITFWKGVRKRYLKLTKDDRKFVFSIFNSYWTISKNVRHDFKERRKRLKQLKKFKKGF